MIVSILWAIYWRIAIRVGVRDPDYPDVAWTNTRPRMKRAGDWLLDRSYP